MSLVPHVEGVNPDTIAAAFDATLRYEVAHPGPPPARLGRAFRAWERRAGCYRRAPQVAVNDIVHSVSMVVSRKGDPEWDEDDYFAVMKVAREQHARGEHVLARLLASPVDNCEPNEVVMTTPRELEWMVKYGSAVPATQAEADAYLHAKNVSREHRLRTIRHVRALRRFNRIVGRHMRSQP